MPRQRTWPCRGRGVIAAALAVPLALTLSPATAAQESPPPPGSESYQLARIADRLDHIARLLADRVETDRVAIAMQRLDLAERRVDQAEAALENARSERENVAIARSRQLRELEAAEAHRRELAARSSLDGEPAVDVERFIEEFRAEIARLDDRLRELDLRRVDLQNQLARRREEVERWSDVVSRALVDPGCARPVAPSRPPGGDG